jgi:glycosyltransferase involved in cell wall biosynthesis
MISIILPTFNRAWSLARCIDSVLQQSFPNFELIVVDDGSDDATKDILASYSDPRIKSIVQNNNGVSHARNRGVKDSSYEILCFIDSDDEWKKHKLKEQLHFHQNHSFRIHQTTEIWIRNGIRVNAPKHLRKTEGDLFSVSLLNCAITPSSVMLEKSLYIEHGGFDEAFPACEDYDLWLKITTREKVGLLNKDLLLRYGGHPDQLSAKYLAMDRFRTASMAKLKYTYSLSSEQNLLLESILAKKSKLLYKGALKHNNQELLTWINEQHWFKKD